MTAVSLREAQLEDLPSIVALLDDDEYSHGREDPSLPLEAAYVTAFRRIDGDPNYMLVVAEAGDVIVGTMQICFLPALSFRGRTRGQLENVRVSSGRRGQGIGRQMVEWAIERCRERDCRAVQLLSLNGRKDAHRFYERLGFMSSHIGMKLALTAQEGRA